MVVTTATGRQFQAQRCYVSRLDGSLNIGLYDVTMLDATIVFSNPEETAVITSAEDSDVNTFTGYTVLTLAMTEPELNGSYLALRRDAT